MRSAGQFLPGRRRDSSQAMASAALFHRKTVLSAPLPSQPGQPFLQHFWLQAFQPRAWLPQAQLCWQTRQRSSSPVSFSAAFSFTALAVPATALLFAEPVVALANASSLVLASGLRSHTGSLPAGRHFFSPPCVMEVPPYPPCMFLSMATNIPLASRAAAAGALESCIRHV